MWRRVHSQGSCRCGSGKDAARCCDAQPVQKRVGSPVAWRRIMRQMQLKLETFVARERFHTDFEQAFSLFAEASPDGIAPEYDAAMNRRFMDWFIHDFRLGNGHRLIELFDLEHGSDLDDMQRRLLRRWKDAYRTALQIIDVPSSQGFRARDLVTGHLLYVDAAEHDLPLVRWSVVIGRPLSIQRNVWKLPQVLAVLPPSAARPVAQRLRNQIRTLNRYFPDMTLQESLRAASIVFEELVQQLAALPIGPVYRTREGDPVLPSRAVYTYDGETEQVARQLRASERIVPVAPERYHLLSESGEVISEVRLSGTRSKRLDILCLSLERLQRSKSWVQQWLGPTVQHQFDALTHPADGALRHTRKSQANPLQEAVPLALRRRKWQDETAAFYRQWVHLKQPALQGKTPLESVQAPMGRLRVAEMLQSMEHIEALKERAGLPFESLTAIKEQLGFDEHNYPWYPALHVPRPEWPRAVDAAVAEQVRKILLEHGRDEASVDSAWWLWHDFQMVDAPTIRKVEPWTGAVLLALAYIEDWPDRDDLVQKAGASMATARQYAMRIRHALQIQPRDPRYSVELVAGTFLAADTCVAAGAETPSNAGNGGPYGFAYFEVVEQMFALRHRVEVQARTMSALTTRAWDRFLSHVPVAEHDALWSECFLDWFIFDWPIPVQGGKRAIELCAESARRNGEACASSLAAWTGRHPLFGRVEIQHSRSDNAYYRIVRLVDLVDEKHHYDVLWPVDDRRLNHGDVLLVRPMPVSDQWLCVGRSIHFDASAAPVLRQRLQEEKRLIERWHGQTMTWDEFRSQHAERFYGIAYRYIEEMQLD